MWIYFTIYCLVSAIMITDIYVQIKEYFYGDAD